MPGQYRNSRWHTLFVPNLCLQKSPTPVPSKEPMEWLTRKLDFLRTLRPWLPDGYERYARVLHPAFTMDLEDEKGVGEISVPWREGSATDLVAAEFCIEKRDSGILFGISDG